jgi:hypothetical protein
MANTWFITKAVTKDLSRDLGSKAADKLRDDNGETNLSNTSN